MSRHGRGMVLAVMFFVLLGLAGCAQQSVANAPASAAAAPATPPKPPMLESDFIPRSEDTLLYIPGFDIQVVGDANVSAFKLGTEFDADGNASGNVHDPSKPLTFSFSASVQDSGVDHKVSVQVDAPGTAAGLYPESEQLSVGNGGIAQFTINPPDGGLPRGDWSIHVFIDGTEAKDFTFSTGSTSK